MRQEFEIELLRVLGVSTENVRCFKLEAEANSIMTLTVTYNALNVDDSGNLEEIIKEYSIEQKE